MKFKILFSLLILFFFNNIKPVAPAMAIAATVTVDSGWSLAGLAVSPQAVMVAGGVMVGQWIYFNFFDDFKPGKTNVPKKTSNKWWHIFRKKEHGFKRGDSDENMKKAVDLIEKERKKGTFKKAGFYELREVVKQGVVLVVRIYVTARSIDFGTMFLKNQACGHNSPVYMGADATA